MIKLVDLTKKYANALPLNKVSVTINDGDIISIIGPSGTGKSTLIRCINLLEKPTSGQIFLDDEEITAKDYDVRKARQKMGMVFQSFNLFGHLTVIENVMLAQTDLLGRSRQEAYDKSIELLRRVGMTKKVLNYPDQLSGGQKQRVAIARTLAMDPEVILLDEPTSALDPTMIGEVQSVIRDVADSGKTMMIVTHEMNFARTISNRVFYMDQGGIYEDGSPEQIFDNPQKELTRRFIKQLKVLEFVIDSRDFDFRGAGSEIDRYCMIYDISSVERIRIHLAFDELVQQILLPKYSVPDIKFTLEYAARDKALTVSADYPGESFDPRNTDNDLALAVLTDTAEDITYEYDHSEKLNHVSIKIRQ